MAKSVKKCIEAAQNVCIRYFVQLHVYRAEAQVCTSDGGHANVNTIHDNSQRKFPHDILKRVAFHDF